MRIFWARQEIWFLTFPAPYITKRYQLHFTNGEEIYISLMWNYIFIISHTHIYISSILNSGEQLVVCYIWFWVQSWDSCSNVHNKKWAREITITATINLWQNTYEGRKEHDEGRERDFLTNWHNLIIKY